MFKEEYPFLGSLALLITNAIETNAIDKPSKILNFIEQISIFYWKIKYNKYLCVYEIPRIINNSLPVYVFL